MITTIPGPSLAQFEDAREIVARVARRTPMETSRFLADRLGVEGGVAGGQEQAVAVAVRDVELGCEFDDHPRARGRAARLDEREVLGGDPGLERQVELAAPAPLAPVAKQRTDARVSARSGHRFSPQSVVGSASQRNRRTA